jgi:dipeptidyl aminopeptidase/acylaminoacyl peptidase
MKTYSWISSFLLFLCGSLQALPQSFSLEDVTAYPFPSSLTAAATGSKIAVAINEKGHRNIFVAEGPAFDLRKITAYDRDEGQEISSINVSADGKWIAYVRGGDHGAYEGSVPRNPSSSPLQQKVQVVCIPFSGSQPRIIGEGDHPVISPNSSQVAYINDGQVWTAPLDGSQPAKKMFFAKGENGALQWSPDGKQLLFVSSRKDHSFVGIFTDSLQPVKWIAPSLARDQSPRWSPDGKRIVFARREARGGKPDSLTAIHPEPWSLWVADAQTGNARQIWKSPATLRGSVPETEGGYNLHWAANDRIVFVSYEDGWPHIYSVPATGGAPLLLTSGDYMVEHIKLGADGKWLVASANTGPDKNDLQRRHIIKVPVDKAAPQVITPGQGIESFPIFSGDGKYIVFLSATAQRPAVVAAVPFDGGDIRLVGEKLIPKNFPNEKLVAPKLVSFTAEDGLNIYGQLFEPKGGPAKKPAIVFVHGGPERQMLLGWHYGDYYSNTYALNQYLASLGFVVLSVNYRLGIGYGFEFQNAPHTWTNGASEYYDVRAAGKWLASQPNIDAQRIGIYGGSYGGFLTALALGKDSKMFRAGVDLHGVHNLTDNYPDLNGEQAPDAALARELIWQSSPVAWLDQWRSPVLLIHGDDDGNVNFSESIDLSKRLKSKGVYFETLVVPDETHHWLKYSNMLKVDSSTAAFLQRQLLRPGAGAGLKGKKICIDPGHGGTAATDSYRVGKNGEREEWINLRVSLLLKQMLEDKGATVMLTRTTDSNVSLEARSAMAKANGADAFISIHHNATADRNVNFPIIYFHGAASENMAGVELAKDIQQSFVKYFFKRNTPVSVVSDYTIFPTRGASVLRGTYGIPAVLAEASFFTNEKEESLLKQKQHNADEAQAYLTALEKFFSAPVPAINDKVIPNELPVFRVLQEAERMDPDALKWQQDFEEGKKLMSKKDTASLHAAYELFSRSARSFPDSYVAKMCHEYRAQILAMLGRAKEAEQEKTRAHEFYVSP